MSHPRALYDGLLSEVYDDYTDADGWEDIAAWDRLAGRTGGPVLELASGTGRVLLPMRAAGHDIEGLDNSADMLARCRRRAAERGLAPELHLADMADFALDRRFALIFCAAGSLTLLTRPGEMEAALKCARAHLAPEGRLALAMDAPAPQPREQCVARDLRRKADGARLRCLLEPLPRRSPEVVRWRMTNEVTEPGGVTRRSVDEIAFRRPVPDRLADMLRDAGFGDIRFLAPDGTRLMPAGAEHYLVLARGAGE